MIFLTLGTQLPFDRLVRALDDWCAATGQGGEVTAQIPDPGARGYRPRSFAWTGWMAPEAYEATAREAAAIVSHAGMGTIITALTLGTPLLIMPRRAALGEHRNDHQLATAWRFADRPGLAVAWDEAELAGTLERLLAGKGEAGERLGPHAEESLVAAVRAEILRD